MYDGRKSNFVLSITQEGQRSNLIRSEIERTYLIGQNRKYTVYECG